MESSETKKEDFFVNLCDVGFQRCNGIFDFWIDILSVGYKESLSSLFRIEKSENKLEIDILFYTIGFEVRKKEQED